MEKEYQESLVFFATCDHCGWEDCESHGSEDEALVSKCQDCSSEDITIEKEYV